MGKTMDRSVCDEVQQETSGLCVSSSGPGSLAGRCSGFLVERVGSVRVSAVSVDSGSAAQSKARSTQFDLDSSGLACSVLVCRSTQTIAGEEACASDTAKAVDSTQVGNSTFKSSAAQAHRLEAVKRRLDAIGASKAAIDFVTKAHRSSTKSVYDSHWRAWNAWCLDNGIDPLSPNEIQLANHLAFLASVKSLSAAALRVRRAAIQTTLRQVGSCTEDSVVVSNVFRGVALQTLAHRVEYQCGIYAWYSTFAVFSV